jgi:hypothetical protein
MPASKNAGLSQRSIYDERYSVGLYDKRSAVHVLTAERATLRRAVERALISHPDVSRISLFDFSYGTGRVINDWIRDYARKQLAAVTELRVAAYDVSSVGLRKAVDALCSAGYEPVAPLTWNAEAVQGYIAGSLKKQEDDLSVTVVFIHGCEHQAPDDMRKLALAANDGDRYTLTTSWYSGLGHIPGEDLRRDYFRQLGELTSPQGEMILCLSSTGDLVEIQPEWSQRLETGDKKGFPIERSGDLVYSTELGQSNFYHIFGIDLNDYMEAITSTGQEWWVEGIRYPDEEFESQEAEQANYSLVCKANEEKKGHRWSAADYREFHTIAAFRGLALRSNGN